MFSQSETLYIQCSTDGKIMKDQTRRGFQVLDEKKSLIAASNISLSGKQKFQEDCNEANKKKKGCQKEAQLCSQMHM